MQAYVLIVIVFSYMSGTAPTISTQEFTTYRACEASRHFIDQTLKDKNWNGSSICVEEA